MGSENSIGGKPRIALVTAWWSEQRRSAVPIALKLVKILQSLSSELTWVITNQSVENLGGINLVIVRSRHVEGALLEVIFYYLWHQAKVTLAMLKLIIRSKVDVFIFASGSDSLFFPILFGRLAGKKVIIKSSGRSSYLVKSDGEKRGRIGIAVRRTMYQIIEAITYSLVDKIAPDCRYMIELYDLQRHSNKVSIGNLYIDTSVFKKTKKLAERTYEIGYIGRFSKEKGTLEFVQSLCLIAADRHIRAIVIGDGELEDEIEKVVARNNIQDKVDLVGWVEHKEIARYLSDIKLLVVPSYREGLPNIVLESMACGTLVLATPVGGIPDVIRDGETGFIMEDNSPECIGRNVIRALSHPNLEQITLNARARIEKEYTYEAAVERYRSMLAT